MAANDPNWAEILTGVGTVVGALGLSSAIVAALFAARQVREAERTRQAAMAAEFLRRWNVTALVETRHLIGEYASPGELSVAMTGFIARARAHRSVRLRAHPPVARSATDRAFRHVEADARRDGEQRLPDVRGAGRAHARRDRRSRSEESAYR